MSDAPWSISSTGPRCWQVQHPQGIAGRPRRISLFASHEEALAFVLNQPEVRRRTTARSGS